MSEYKLRYVTGGERKEISFSPVGEFDFEDFFITATEKDGRNTVSVTAKADAELIKCTRRGVGRADEKDLCLINGYQSWTKTKEYFMSGKERNVNKLPRFLLNAYSFDAFGDASFFDYDKGILHGYDVFYVKKEDGAFIINANYENAYLTIVLDRRTGEISLRNELDGMHITAGRRFTVSDYYFVNGYGKGLELFGRLFPERNVKKILGYTSWYNYYQDINEEIILRDLDALDDRFDLFQIDDGYESFVGDWLKTDEKKFPNGLKGVVEKIHDKGLKAGIWLAPFVAEEKSEVFAAHPEWFDFGGKTVKCGSNWSGFYALNLDIKEVRDYIRGCLEYYAELGFDFFKLDFLYAANLPAYYGRTRSQAAEDAYGFLREVLKDKLILGCGATLFNAAGKFDYMRIGPDVSLIFDDVWYMKFMHNERISTKNTLQNTIYRSFMNDRLFGNDPDVFLLRDDNIKLSERQKDALITINALFGSVLMTSDNIADYDAKKEEKLKAALDLFYNAKVVSFARKHDVIFIEYEKSGERYAVKYNYKRGVML